MTTKQPRTLGFTLLELVIVIAIFGLILTAAYQVLISTLQADDRINEVTRTGKIGEAVLNLIRRDLQGTIWRGLGNEVFLIEDNGEGESANDEIQFLTTARVPRPPVDFSDEWSGEVASVGYVTKSGQEGKLVLFRRVKWLTEIDDPFDGGSYFPIYEHVRAISFEVLDENAEWIQDWSSESRIPEIGNTHETELERTAGEPVEDPDLFADDEELLDDEEEIVPLIVPRAVRIELQIYIGDEQGLYLGPDGQPLIESYTTVVPILAVENLELPEDLEVPAASAGASPTGDTTPDESGTGGGNGGGGSGLGGAGSGRG